MKKILIILILVGILVVSFFYFRNEKDQQMIFRGNIIIQKIEDFKRNKGYLPNSLNDIGINDNELFYNKWDSVHYMIWYGTTLGESVTYYSDSKKWEDSQRGFN
jgi:type II secretory pathway pseudopilin PulG